MATDCPYCSLAKKTGDLYCSKHQADMSALKSGVFYIREKSFEECEPHVTRLSLNFNLDNRQSYLIGNKSFTVSPEKYLLINEGQSFSTFANGMDESRMVTIAFKVGLAEQLYHTLSHDHHELLSQPRSNDSSSLHFFEQTYFMDDYLHQVIPNILTFSDHGCDEVYLQEILDELLVHILSVQLGISRDINSIQKTKTSTKLEIYKRLHSAYEFIHDNFNREITVDDIADHACLSSFHFKRLFKEFYGQSPHQLIINLRIRRAQALLKTNMMVKDICHTVGFENASSFIRLFKKMTQLTPDQYRQDL